MKWTEILSFSSRSFFVPWVQFTSPEGNRVDGPLLRKALGRRELLVWTVREEAEQAAQELIAKTGGSFEVKVLDRRGVEKQSRVYSTWKSPVVAVIFKS
jgi:hypothetical protein